MTPKESLIAGCRTLDEVMAPAGFAFKFRDAGHSSGGNFAWGEYVRSGRQLELHFRWSLGLVAYHFEGVAVDHSWLVRAATDRPGTAEYPGFSDVPLDGFRHLLHDLQAFGGTFLTGEDDELRSLLRRARDLQAAAPKGLSALPR